MLLKWLINENRAKSYKGKASISVEEGICALGKRVRLECSVTVHLSSTPIQANLFIHIKKQRMTVLIRCLLIS